MSENPSRISSSWYHDEAGIPCILYPAPDKNSNRVRIGVRACEMTFKWPEERLAWEQTSRLCQLSYDNGKRDAQDSLRKALGIA